MPLNLFDLLNLFNLRGWECTLRTADVAVISAAEDDACGFVGTAHAVKLLTDSFSMVYADAFLAAPCVQTPEKGAALVDEMATGGEEMEAEEVF